MPTSFPSRLILFGKHEPSTDPSCDLVVVSFINFTSFCNRNLNVKVLVVKKVFLKVLLSQKSHMYMYSVQQQYRYKFQVANVRYNIINVFSK